MTVVETPFFLRKASALIAEDERAELVVFLGMNPEAGPVVPDAGGVRKLRWAAEGRGKRVRRRHRLRGQPRRCAPR